MAISKSQFSSYVRSFNFRELFNELGWNNDNVTRRLIIDGINFNITSIAEKAGFRILVCESQSGKGIPAHQIRKKIEHQVTKLFFEHLIIFIDGNRKEQIWQFAVRRAGSPVKITETRYNIIQTPELLYQRAGNLFFTLDEEDKVTIVDVTQRVSEQFQQNSERVTKRFYERFKKEHKAFKDFIEGIDDAMTVDWYASLMLNRLMFCYFIQKKGFLDDNRNYLQDKLFECRLKIGSNQFYSFYRGFLLVLFHQGLGTPESIRDKNLELGRIPYLNGGLFDEHSIERMYGNIEIEDEAFEKVFEFFDQYEWHLDTRITASGRDINPDVIGYIFEKYINDRAQMGAYYTKEDITDYIGKNSIIPWLFDEVKRHYAKPFGKNGWLWNTLKASGDNYIYEAVKYGIPEEGELFDDLPEEIKQGFDPELEKKVVDGQGPWLWEIRKYWNKPAPQEIALPTETYRELIERRNRYAEVKDRIESGEITDIKDFITYNLDIRQFTEDILENAEDTDFVRHFYKALTSVTILDPTCGSGAFLFAALNILQPLYEKCILKMESFIEKDGKGKHTCFDDELKKIKAPEHPNIEYFIYKSIILNNLYGVDIMNEAVEIAKLRLFLKLVAAVDTDFNKPNFGLEPLPDIDFNIRAGNTLIGLTSETEIESTFHGKLDLDNDLQRIKDECRIVSDTFRRYKEVQLEGYTDFEAFKEAKDDLTKRLSNLRNELNLLLHKHYYENLNYENWLSTHQPFHWLAEFYEIINERGGFDVVIGNPPYVEYSQVRKDYTLVNYETEKCGNLYGFVFERSFNISQGIIGLIIQLSAISTITMGPLQKFIKSNSRLVFSGVYPERPKQLFDGACIAVSILICVGRSNIEKILSCGINRSTETQREMLFDSLYYANCDNEQLHDYQLFPKFSNSLDLSIYSKIKSNNSIQKYLSSYPSDNNTLYYRTAGGRYWKLFLLRDFQHKSTSNKKKTFSKDCDCRVFCAILNSNLYWWFFANFFDLYNLKDYMIFSFPFTYDMSNEEILSRKGTELMNSYEENSESKKQFIKSKNQIAHFEVFNPRLSKLIIDEIDSVLARHYGFNHAELDYIVNYDLQYKMRQVEE